MSSCCVSTVKSSRPPGPNLSQAKLAERDDRHAKAGESRYLVEPNIKDGKGGLRDLHTLFWIGKYFYRVRTARRAGREGCLHRARSITSFARPRIFSGQCAATCISSPARQRSG